MIQAFAGKTPKIGKKVFLAKTAVVIGDVEIGDGANHWHKPDAIRYLSECGFSRPLTVILISEISQETPI